MEIKDSDFYKLKASDAYNQIMIETLKTILYEKDIISGNIELEEYISKVFKNDSILLNNLNTSLFAKNLSEMLEKEDQLSEEDEKYLRENLMYYCDDINTEEQVEDYIKTVKEKKQLHISMKQLFGFDRK
jgi:hypothetical protein